MPSSKPVSTSPGAFVLSAELITLIDALPGPILVVDRAGKIQACNNAARTTAGAVADRLTNLKEWLPADTIRALRSGPDGAAAPRSAILSASDASSPVYEWTTRALDTKGDPVVFAGRDVSREVELMDQIIGNQWFETSAALAGGLAHNFNNKIAAILGLSEIIGMRLPKGSPMLDYTGKINLSIDRTKPLVKRLGQSCRKSTGTVQAEPTAAIVEDLGTVLASFLPGNAPFECKVSEKTPWCRVDRHAFEHIVLNCVLFARSRLRETGGKVKLTCEPDKKDKRAVIFIDCSGVGFKNLDTTGIFTLDLSPKASAYESGTAMYVARLLAESGGMNLNAEPTGSQSFRFILTLPSAPAFEG